MIIKFNYRPKCVFCCIAGLDIIPRLIFMGLSGVVFINILKGCLRLI